MKKLCCKVIWKFFLAVLFFFLCTSLGKVGREVFITKIQRQPTFILDAGHGGVDGGALSLSGEKESVINLEITLCMEQMLVLMGESPLLLRREDVSLHDNSAVTIREKKVSDLKNRATAVNANHTATLVSIHQNSFPESKYAGSQVFYASTGGSKELAADIQNALRTYLQQENTRQEKLVSDNIYLLNHVENCAVLIECGFLSNPEEEKLLQQADYQKQLSLVLVSALCR